MTSLTAPPAIWPGGHKADAPESHDHRTVMRRPCRVRGCPHRGRVCPDHTAVIPPGYAAFDRLVREKPYVGPIRAGVTP